MELNNEEEEVFAYHVESTNSNQERVSTLSKNSRGVKEANLNRDEDEKSKNNDIKINDMKPATHRKGLSFETNHFSIYIVGTNTKHDSSSNPYEMEVGETLELEVRGLSGGSWKITSGRNYVSITSNGLEATVTALAEGNATIRYRTPGGIFGYGSESRYFYIKVTDPNRESYDIITPAIDDAINPDAGKVDASKTANWVDYDNRIAEIIIEVEGIPAIYGSDVILVMDVSGSMSSNDRIGTAQDASVEFIDELLGGGNPTNNRVAFIPFEGSSGGAGEFDDVTKGSVNFSYDVSQLNAHVNATSADGSTNYTAALAKAIQYVDSRLAGEDSRPLYIVFMSDGAPGKSGNSPNDTSWNGVNQANDLKNLHDATIYTVGIQISESNAVALKNISSDENGDKLYQSVTNMSDLEPVLDTIAGVIKNAGTNAVFEDHISGYFNYYNVAPYDNGHGTYNGDPNNPIVRIEVGEIREDVRTFKTYVQLKQDYWNIGQHYPTNDNIYLNYTDIDGDEKEKDKSEIGEKGYVTREEVTAVFYRLLETNYRNSIWTETQGFTDVGSARWSLRHIGTLSNGKIVLGYPDGTFRPGNNITRAELAAIASRFDNLSPSSANLFSDIEGHWAAELINSASIKGWVNGYPDGTYKPDQYITRAEFVTLVNNVLGRKAHKDYLLEDRKEFPDLLEGAWYYVDMQEAINSHLFNWREDGFEEWTEIVYPEIDM